MAKKSMTAEAIEQGKANFTALKAEGKTVDEIAIELDIDRTTAFKWQRDFREAERQVKVDAVSNLDPSTVLAIAERLEGTSPTLAKNLQHLSQGLESLNKLEPVIHNALGDVIVLAQERMQDPSLKTNEFKTLGELIMKGYATLYNRPTVEVNVQNNTLVQQAAKDKINGLLHGIIEVEEEEIR